MLCERGTSRYNSITAARDHEEEVVLYGVHGCGSVLEAEKKNREAVYFSIAISHPAIMMTSLFRQVVCRA